MQAFPGAQFNYLRQRVSDLVTELDSFQNTFEEIRKLNREIEKYQDHVEHFEPIAVEGHKDNYVVHCRGCRVTDFGESLIKAINKIKHKPKCGYLEDQTELSPLKITRWLMVLFPGEEDKLNILKKN